MARRQTLIMVAKYPTPGRCKTRLALATSADFAVEFAMCAIQDLIERLARFPESSHRIQLVLLYAPMERKQDFTELLATIPGSDIEIL